MKKQFLFFVLILLSFSVSLSSCKKEDEETKKDLFAARWEGEKVTSSLIANGITIPVPEEDISGSFVEFKSDGTYSSSGNGFFEGSGTWKFSNGEKDIILDEGTTDETIATIDALTQSDLKLSISEQETEDGITFQVKIIIDLKR
jgi:hypothetical protein